MATFISAKIKLKKWIQIELVIGGGIGSFSSVW